MHAFADAQETPDRLGLVRSRGLGIACTAHDTPFQRSERTNVCPVLVVQLPTATHILLDGQETPDREDETAALGLWVG